MEDIESFFEGMIVFIALIGGVISTVKKSQRHRVQEAAQQSAAQARVKAAQQQIKAAQRQAQTRSAAFPGMSFPDVPGQVMTPTVHPHLQPDCDTHDVPGSLGFVSTEGKDPCHEEQLTHVRTPEEKAPEQSRLTFDWTGNNLVKAVVMQEVLTRPVHRRAR